MKPKTLVYINLLDVTYQNLYVALSLQKVPPEVLYFLRHKDDTEMLTYIFVV